MNVRDATIADREAIETVARDSLAASYGSVVDAAAIDAIVAELYGPDRFADRLAGRSDLVLVAVDEAGELVGFVDGALVNERPLTAEIYWLHVAPARRGEGVSDHLLGQFYDHARDRGARRVRGMVLAGNEDGVAYYAAKGFDRVDAREVAVGGQSHEELVYERALDTEPGNQVVEAITGPEGRNLFVTLSESERGRKAPFFAVYADGDLTDRYGFRCGNCDSLAVSVDSMDRIRCENCGNERLAARWDAAYL